MGANHVERLLRGTTSEVDLDLFKRKTWPGIVAEFVRFTIPAEIEFRLVHSDNYLALLNINRSDGETVVPGYGRSYNKQLRNKINFIPRGCELNGWSLIEKPSSCISIYLEGRVKEQDGADISELPPFLEFEDRMLRSVVLQIDAILHDPSLDTPGYAETLGTLLAYELGRLKNQSKDVRATQGGLTPRQVRVVTEYLESRLTDKTTIAELSALVALSRFHFIRAFKKTVGMPPHQFVVHRRVERACELLHDPRLSVSEIATKTGFNSTTHFTKSFRRITGATPTTYRRDVQ